MIFGISVNTSKNNYDKIVSMIEFVLKGKSIIVRLEYF